MDLTSYEICDKLKVLLNAFAARCSKGFLTTQVSRLIYNKRPGGTPGLFILVIVL